MDINPFTPEPPVTSRADPGPSTTCDVIGFNGQGQLCHTRMSKMH